MIKTIVLKITSKCNWKCSYCDNRGNQDVDINKLISFIQLLQLYNKNTNISLSGGEPGLLSENYFSQLFSVVNNQVEVCTNGTFFKNNYHKIFKDKIKEFWYHVTPEILNNKIEFNKIDTSIPIQYIFVIHKKNLHEVIPFIQKHKEIIFRPSFYKGDDEELILTLDDIKYLYNNDINKLNITNNYKDRIEYFNSCNKYKINKAQTECYKICYIPRIDLITNTIYRCCAGNSSIIDSIELNDNTLKMLLKYNIFLCSTKNKTICKSCFNGAWNCKDYV